MKEYVVYAGVNGAGKSSLYHTIDPKTLKRVNSDEILVAYGGNWQNSSQSLSAMRESVRLARGYLESGVSFCRETTLTGNSILKSIKFAKQQGYFITMHYIGLESADLAVRRVAERVKKGGHGIPEGDIRRRYTATLENFKEVIHLCDKIRVYDNTDFFRRIAVFQNGEIVFLSDDDVGWFSRAFPAYTNTNQNE